MGSFIADQAAAGLLPLQDHDPRFNTPGNLHTRAVRYALRITGRENNERYEIDSIGDVVCSTYWAPVEGDRPIGAWAYAFPVMALRGSYPRGMTSTGAASAPTGYLPLSDAYRQDARFEVLTPPDVPRHPGLAQRAWSTIPYGTMGILTSATSEKAQREVFLHGDPRIVAVNQDGNPHMGSLVCDLTDEDWYSPDRAARLQSMMRVVLPDDSLSGVPPIPRDPDRPGQRLPALAWNLATGGSDNVWGLGLFIDRVSSAPVPPSVPPPVPT